MKFDSALLDRIRSSVNLVDLISGYARLRKQGQNFVGLCPFHQEKTPSFSVSETKQIFKCFGCGAGGDAFGFIQQIEHLSFPEAVEFLARRSGIPIEHPAGPASDESSRMRARLLEIMQSAEEYFRSALEQDAEALEYLTERDISAETVEQFGLGYAPGGGRLEGLLERKGYRIDELESCGLLVRNEAGERYEKFRRRLMFPIRNLSGQAIAFGGRLLGDGRPKYLNSPETPLYHKGMHLYGLGVSRDAIRRQGFAVVVEGYFDCIIPHQFGVRNVVASLGTALTESQVRLLGRYTRRVVVNFDPDTAGMAAALRSIDLFLAGGFQVNVLTLPGGEDPDSYLRHQGVAGYQERIKTSLPFVDFLLDFHLARQKNPGSPASKQRVTDEVMPYLARLPNRVERAEYLSRLASRLAVPEAVLVAELRKYSRRREGAAALRPPAQPEPTPAEKTLVAALSDERLRHRVLAVLEPDLFTGLRTEKLFRRIFESANQTDSAGVFSMRAVLEGEDLDLFDRLSMGSLHSLTEEAVRNSLEAVGELQISRLSLQIQEEIARCEKSGEASERLDELLRRKQDLLRRRHQ
jgi:DNA primase